MATRNEPAAVKAPARTDYEWALELEKRSPKLFDVDALMTTLWVPRKAATGELWYAYPTAAWAELVGYKSGRTCPGIIREGQWHPLDSERPASPMAFKFYVHDEDGAPSLRLGARPGIILGDSYTQTPISRPLRTFGHVIWVRGSTRPPDKHQSPHAELPIRFYDGRISEFPLWTAWGTSGTSGAELLKMPDPPNERSLSECQSVRPADGQDLAARARQLFAEAIGVRSWSGRQRWYDPSTDILQRGELVLIRLPSGHGVPCLVISPRQINSNDKLIALQCISDEVDPDDPCYVPLSPKVQFQGKPLHAGLHLVRGIAFAGRHVDRWTPERIYYDKIDQKTFDHIHKQLRALYA